MTSRIPNYTTSVDVEKTVTEIQRRLARYKVRAVAVEYDDEGEPVGMSFSLVVGEQPLSFKMPVRWQGLHAILKEEYHGRKVPWAYSTPEQAKRVTWRILKDWIEAQLALTDTGILTIDQVFFSYATDAQGISFYEYFMSRRALKSGGTGDSGD